MKTKRQSLDWFSSDANTRNLHDLVLKGFPFAALVRFERESGLSRAEVCDVIRLPARTLVRRKEAGRLSAGESDRLHRLARLFRRAVEFFRGNADEARDWLKTPRPVLGDRTPLSLAGTSVGARDVEDLIYRLEQGVFS